MKPHIQKLPLNEQTSFVARTYRTPHFEVGWHQHIEHELILFTEGGGLGFIGNHIGPFETGDIFLIGSNLPHTFQKIDPELITSAIVVQFQNDFWGDTFINLPECQGIRKILSQATYGIRPDEKSKAILDPLIRQLENAQGFSRLHLLGECLNTIAESDDATLLSTQRMENFSHKDTSRIDEIFRYTLDNFKEHISLEQVSEIACMSVPAFCNYFKRSTQQTYIDFLNQVKIGYAASLLLDTEKPIHEICFESGYATPVNFHRQFVKQKLMTPLAYRKSRQRIIQSID